MAYYKYIARTQDGKPEEGFVEAASQDELVGVLQSRGLMVVSFKETEREGSARISSKKRRMHSGVKIDDLITFSRQIATLLGAGITLLRSLEITAMQISSSTLASALDMIKKDVSGGNSLKVAVAKHPKIFSKFWVNVIETGETTGQLAFALQQIASYMEASAELQRKIKNALVYPGIILSVATIAILVFVTYIMPMFSKMYADYDAKLPAFTLLVFGFCLGVKKFLPIIIAGVIGLIVGLHYYGKTQAGRENIDRFKLGLPVFGDIIKQVGAVRFASGLSMLIKSGTPILHALDIVSETSGNVIIMDMLQRVKQNVREGKSMAEPLLSGGIFPDMLSHMVAVGEESGELSNMLENSAKFYNERVDATVSRLTTLFEPVLIVSIGAIVGTMVVAMFLPIFGLSSAMK